MSFTKKISRYPLESILSYLLRVSNSNYIGILDLWNLCKVNTTHEPSLNDIVRMIFSPSRLINIDLLSYYTGLAAIEFLDLTLFNLLKKFKSGGSISDARNVCGILREEYHYCLQCLSDRPFHSLLWTINDINYCAIHHTYLQKSCVRCNHTIQLKEITDLSYCPHCGGSLICNKVKEIDFDSDFIKRQEWYINNYTFLLNRSDASIGNQELGIKLLFVLNEYKSVLNKDTVSKSLGKNAYILPTLLQHARSTLSQNRILNLSFILDTLYAAGSTIQQLFRLDVPSEFYLSITDKPIPIIKRMRCIAPWCTEPDSLIKTGTSFRRTKRGSLKYYMACRSCGCQYALDDNDTLVERTKFIGIYKLLKTVSQKTLSLKSLCLKSGFTAEDLRRGLAYFDSRGLFNFKNYHIKFDDNKLQSILCYIQSNHTIKAIRKLNIWENYFEFLYYRYHQKVLLQGRLIYKS